VAVSPGRTVESGLLREDADVEAEADVLAGRLGCTGEPGSGALERRTAEFVAREWRILERNALVPGIDDGRDGALDGQDRLAHVRVVPTHARRRDHERSPLAAGGLRVGRGPDPGDLERPLALVPDAVRITHHDRDDLRVILGEPTWSAPAS
jgi:hypothetical protein